MRNLNKLSKLLSYDEVIESRIGIVHQRELNQVSEGDTVELSGDAYTVTKCLGRGTYRVEWVSVAWESDTDDFDSLPADFESHDTMSGEVIKATLVRISGVA